ncbi:alpha,alpha-trehalose-phosphate synthase [Celeribacter indicus]|uniref:Alpha,alpha-trehalose-phosphate synthase n=1 Tax=Celeribacter indicus TaxID=1208324 RepID=A0A0B5E9R2_9RHOB|nr:alpha,alpha-trehalose-phosphate synthase [Celeribacter indicus]
MALHDALAERGGVWIGAGPEPGEASEALEVIGRDPYVRLAFTLTETEQHDYYLGFSNSVLWPLCHRRGDLVDLDPDFEAAYRAVNARLARAIAKVLEADDVLWVHDYHLFPLAQALRRLGVTNRIGFFLHIPFPTLTDLAVLPKPSDFARWLASYNLVGFQTRADTARCLEMFRADPRAEFMTDGTVKFEDKIVRLGAFPIGIDTETFARDAEGSEESPFRRDAPEEYLIGVDRLDYSKGLPNRFNAFARYLEERTDPERRPCLVQIAPPTREAVQAYQDIRRELEEISGHINGAYAELDWTPIRYIHRAVDRSRLARIYRHARACLVTSLADGMNLVAKEYVAAQQPDDPGVLILSRFAGAAEDLTDALLVNPYDEADIARAIAVALDMPLEERVDRYESCIQAVRDTDVRRWSKQFLAGLDRTLPSFEWPKDEFSAGWPLSAPDDPLIA